MPMVIHNVSRELKKAAQGKRTKISVGLLLWIAMRDCPGSRAYISRAFSLTEYGPYGHKLDAYGKRVRAKRSASKPRAVKVAA
jgi:hypothetical protein